jgi:hypothetical protein
MFEWAPLEGWILSIDREATRAAYKNLSAPWPSSCTCLYCENFVAASHLLPPEFVQFCLDAGIESTKPREVYELSEGTETGTRLYAGWYHLVGQIKSSPEPELITGSSLITTPQYSIPLRLVGDFAVRFSDKPNLVKEGFPRPIIQLDFSGAIPWVLKEKPESD